METENQETEMDNNVDEAPVDQPVPADEAPVPEPAPEPVAPVPVAPAAPLSLDEMLALGGTNIQTGLTALRQNNSDGVGAAEALLAAESRVRHVDEDGGEIKRTLGLAVDRQIENYQNLKASLNL